MQSLQLLLGSDRLWRICNDAVDRKEAMLVGFVNNLVAISAEHQRYAHAVALGAVQFVEEVHDCLGGSLHYASRVHHRDRGVSECKERVHRRVIGVPKVKDTLVNFDCLNFSHALYLLKCILKCI